LNQNWHGTLIRHMLLLITACLVIGLISGYYGWGPAGGLGGFLAWALNTSGCANINPMSHRLMVMVCGAKSSTAFTTCNAATNACAVGCKR